MKKNLLFYQRVLILLLPIVAIIVILHYVQKPVQESLLLRNLGEDFQTYRWKKWEIYSAQSREANAQLARDMDKFLHVFYKKLGPALELEPIEGKIKIIVYKGFQDLQAARRDGWRRDISAVSGYYDPSTQMIAVYQRESYPVLRRVLYHEITHFLLDVSVPSYNPRWSLWFNEGLAGYLEHSNLKKGSKFEFGGLGVADFITMRDMFLKGEMIPLRQLVTGSHEDFQKKDRASQYYAQSAWFCFFLFHGKDGKYRQRFINYFAIERKPGRADWSDFRTAFPKAAEVEKDFRSFLKETFESGK